jgi:hypothetical protein
MERFMEIKVEDKVLSKEVCERELNRIRHNQPGMDEAELKEKTVNSLIQQTIIQIEAEKRFPQIPKKEIELEFEKLCIKYGGKENFFRQFNFNKNDEPRIKDDLKQSMKINRLIEEITRDISEASETEIKDYYEAHKEMFVKPEEVHAAHIVKKPEQGKEYELYHKMRETREKLLAGAEFDKMADEFSDCQESGGDLGYFSWEKMVDEFSMIVFSMKPGEISPVFRTQFGFHLAKVYDHREKQIKPLEDCRSDVSKIVIDEHKAQFIENWIEERRERFDITVTD